jgi:N utilization substance protein B
MVRRSRAREVALQVLYQDDLNPRGNPALADQWVARRLSSEAAAAFARQLVAGVRRCRAELDGRIEAAAVNWSLGRMAATDRNVLRLGAYELLHTDTPPRVAINEAVELAKRYGTRQSAAFVNGILDRLMHEKEGAAPPAPAPGQPPAEPGNGSAADAQREGEAR